MDPVFYSSKLRNDSIIFGKDSKLIKLATINFFKKFAVCVVKSFDLSSSIDFAKLVNV